MPANFVITNLGNSPFSIPSPLSLVLNSSETRNVPDIDGVKALRQFFIDAVTVRSILVHGSTAGNIGTNIDALDNVDEVRADLTSDSSGLATHIADTSIHFVATSIVRPFSISEWFTTANQAFTTVLAVDFQDGRFFGPFDIFLVNDDTFEYQVNGDYKVTWSLTIENTDGSNICDVLVEVNDDGVGLAGSSKKATLAVSSFQTLSDTVYILGVATPQQLQLEVTRTAGTGTPRVVSGMAKLIFERF